MTVPIGPVWMADGRGYRTDDFVEELAFALWMYDRIRNAAGRWSTVKDEYLDRARYAADALAHGPSRTPA